MAPNDRQTESHIPDPKNLIVLNVANESNASKSHLIDRVAEPHYKAHAAPCWGLALANWKVDLMEIYLLGRLSY